jgi:hypothetical protein
LNGQFRFNVRIGEPVLNSLTVTPTVANGNSGALTFSPASAIFTPGSPSVVTFVVTGNLLHLSGNGWLTRFVLSGSDQNLFWVTNPAVLLDNYVKVTLRAAPIITPLDTLATNNALYAGVCMAP